MQYKTSLLVSIGALASSALIAQISLNNIGDQEYTQNFAGLSGTTWSDNSTLSGWYADWANDPNWEPVPVGGANGLLRYGANDSGTEYALGSRNTGGNPTVTFGANFLNNTGQAININIDYQGEQWFIGSQTNNTTGLTFEYSTNATSLSTGTWTAVTDLDFYGTSNSGSGTLLTPGNELIVSSIASDINFNVANGSQFWIRWTDTDDGTGTDHGLAVDSFKLDTIAVPEPSTFAMLSGMLALACVMLRRR